MTSRRNLALIAFACVLTAGTVYALRQRPSGDAATASKTPSCDMRVTKAELEKSIELGSRFMLNHQKTAGNFDYEYDWRKHTNSKEDNAVRQSGALWGLALLHNFAGAGKASPELRAGLKRGLAFFDDRSATTKDGGRYPVYKTDTEQRPVGGVGMAALVTLSIVDYVRSLPPTDPEHARWKARANEYIGFLTSLVQDDGLWPGDYRYDTGAGTGAHSSYSDGEALLALVTAMKYLGRDDLRPLIERVAVAGHKVNIEQALAAEKDSATTKGYYQWSSMAFYELATSSMGTAPNAPPYGTWLLALADWILDVHQVIGKPRNTGYAYEGIVSSFAWAKKTKDPRAEKYSCAIHQGLSTLLGWQVGHPRAEALGAVDDEKGIGGVQNHATEAPLRIDVVQHQMHATMLAIEHLF